MKKVFAVIITIAMMLFHGSVALAQQYEGKTTIGQINRWVDLFERCVNELDREYGRFTIIDVSIDEQVDGYHLWCEAYDHELNTYTPAEELIINDENYDKMLAQIVVAHSTMCKGA